MKLKYWKLFLSLQSIFLLVSTPAVIAKESNQESVQLRADKLKILLRREPRCKDLIPKVEKSISDASSTDSARRRLELLEHTIMSASSVSAARLSDAVDLLENLTGSCRLLSAEDLKSLQEQYQKLCDLLDDQILAKDLDSALNLHDRFVKLAAMGVWDKEQTQAQIEKIKQAASRAPAIPYGRQELLRNLESKKIAAPAKGCYIGVHSQNHIYLSTNRDAIAILEESTGASLQMESADLLIQGEDGKLYDLTTANHPANGLPFSPPLSVWYKSRLVEGHIPAIQFRLNGKTFVNPHKDLCIQDILDGKLDEYLSRNIKEIAQCKATVMIGLGDEFDREACATAFGADGRTPYYLLIDPKLAKLSPEHLHSQLPHRLVKGSFTKDIGAELRKYYGDPEIPDGPERVRDAWKHISSLIHKNGAHHVSVFSCAGSFHGNKKALVFPGCVTAGVQDWNKLEYYWPGPGILDWIGSATEGSEVEMNVNTYSLLGSIDYFEQEAKTSAWRHTPVVLNGVGPGKALPAAQESVWLSACFQSLLPTLYPRIKACLLNFPQQITLQSPESFSTFRRGVASNPYYKQVLNLTHSVAGNK